MNDLKGREGREGIYFIFVLFGRLTANVNDMLLYYMLLVYHVLFCFLLYTLFSHFCLYIFLLSIKWRWKVCYNCSLHLKCLWNGVETLVYHIHVARIGDNIPLMPDLV